MRFVCFVCSVRVLCVPKLGVVCAQFGVLSVQCLCLVRLVCKIQEKIKKEIKRDREEYGGREAAG